MPKQLTTKEFIEKAKKIHGDKYDYSNVKYITSSIKVDIKCKENKHGIFKQVPNSHLSGAGCPRCSNKIQQEKQLKSQEYFLERSRKIHGDKYNYDESIYKGSGINVTIICNTHGKFQQKPENHYAGKGCRKCGGKIVTTTEEFIEKAKEIHGDKYDYSNVKYITSHIEVDIKCKENKHGIFKQVPNSHLSGAGCPRCSNNKKLTTEEFIEKAKEIHGNRYDYSEINYVNANIHVTIKCKEHDSFKQTPGHHLDGNGCPKCINKTEGKVFNFLLEILDKDDIQYQYSPAWAINKNGNKVLYDFYISSINVIFEIDGEQHFDKEHKWYNEQHNKDIEKTILANQNEIFIIRFVQQEIWNNSIDWKKIINELLMNKITENKFISNDINKYNIHKKMINELI